MSAGCHTTTTTTTTTVHAARGKGYIGLSWIPSQRASPVVSPSRTMSSVFGREYSHWSVFTIRVRPVFIFRAIECFVVFCCGVSFIESKKTVQLRNRGVVGWIIVPAVQKAKKLKMKILGTIYFIL